MKKFKSLLANDQFFIVAVVFLVGILSFGLGRWSVLPPNLSASPIISIEEISNAGRSTISEEPERLPEETDSRPTGVSNESRVVTGITSDLVVVASRNGSRYHLPSCPGAKQIKPENLITFSSVAEARAAGYTPAANCPGL